MNFKEFKTVMLASLPEGASKEEKKALNKFIESTEVLYDFNSFLQEKLDIGEEAASKLIDVHLELKKNDMNAIVVDLVEKDVAEEKIPEAIGNMISEHVKELTDKYEYPRGDEVAASTKELLMITLKEKLKSNG